ncbi:MAG: GNAT family N-acetyltransferase [Eggerthellaceae bacterium]|nr:GNAT family N-acetyltransferase [Eggerthellaceae bacterium]
MEFRPAGSHEIDRVMEILTDGREALAELGIDQWQQGYPHREAIEADVAWGESYVAEQDGRLLGTCMVTFRGDPNYDEIDGKWLTESVASEPRYAAIHRVAVAADARGLGVAKFLMASAEALARETDCESVRVDTHPGNFPMRNLALRCGFEKCGVIQVLEAGNVPNATPDRVAFEKIL